jgi:hypothetical protein
MSYDYPSTPPTEAGYPPPPPPTPESPKPQRRRWPWIVGGVVVVLLVVAAIAAGMGDEDNTDTADRPDSTVTPPAAQPAEGDTPTTAEAAEPTSDVPEAARNYFEALASEDLSRMGAMVDNSVEDSPAALYAVHQIATLRGLGTQFGTTMDVGDDTIALTTITGYDNSGTEQTETTTYGGFTVEGDKLTGFNVNDTPVADRIRAGGDPVTVDGVSVRVVSAYHSAVGNLILNVDVTNGRQGPIELSDFEWLLVTADGRQVSPAPEAVNMSPGTVQPGATAGRIAGFEQVGLGGTLRFVAFADDFVTDVRFDVPVPA